MFEQLLVDKLFEDKFVVTKYYKEDAKMMTTSQLSIEILFASDRLLNNRITTNFKKSDRCLSLHSPSIYSYGNWVPSRYRINDVKKMSYYDKTLGSRIVKTKQNIFNNFLIYLESKLMMMYLNKNNHQKTISQLYDVFSRSKYQLGSKCIRQYNNESSFGKLIEPDNFNYINISWMFNRHHYSQVLVLNVERNRFRKCHEPNIILEHTDIFDVNNLQDPFDPPPKTLGRTTKCSYLPIHSSLIFSIINSLKRSNALTINKLIRMTLHGSSTRRKSQRPPSRERGVSAQMFPNNTSIAVFSTKFVNLILVLINEYFTRKTTLRNFYCNLFPLADCLHTTECCLNAHNRISPIKIKRPQSRKTKPPRISRIVSNDQKSINNPNSSFNNKEIINQTKPDQLTDSQSLHDIDIHRNSFKCRNPSPYERTQNKNCRKSFTPTVPINKIWLESSKYPKTPSSKGKKKSNVDGKKCLSVRTTKAQILRERFLKKKLSVAHIQVNER
ncbi:hypothetical protein SNEBB_006078 [Seison nebaliae]|nr:hypothetical protein SNEBB_006078 [Seison nebaliae]